MIMSKKSIFTIIIALLFNIQVFAADWPQWRGENRDGIWREKGIVQKFQHEQLPICWRVKIANGYSGPTVAKGRVYITDRLTSPDKVERIHCFDAKYLGTPYILNYKNSGDTILNSSRIRIPGRIPGTPYLIPAGKNSRDTILNSSRCLRPRVPTGGSH